VIAAIQRPDSARHVAAEVKPDRRDLTHYCDPQGVLPLREAIARDMSTRRGIRVTPDRVVVFPGAKPPIGLCQEAYCDPGDEVVYPNPGFPIYESFTRFIGAKPVPLHLQERSGFSFTGAELEPLISERTKLVILNFPSNPTGGVATRPQLEGIAEVIRRRAGPDVRIYSDEVYENILFDGAAHHSIATLPGMEEKTIVVSGVSKTYSWTGGRIGWAAFPSVQEAAVFKNLNINYFSCVPAYNNGGAGRHRVARRARRRSPGWWPLQERRDVVVRGLNAIPGITCQTPRGAFYVFPNIGGVCESIGAIAAFESLPAATRARTSPSTLFQMFLLYRHHVATLDRKSFGQIGAEGRHFLRISIATGMDDLKQALARIEAAATDRDGFRAFVQEGTRLY
jgi:aspartate/methionine/tyrosine aminotransferase